MKLNRNNVCLNVPSAARPAHRAGMALLLTLMILVVITAVLVQYQVEATLFIRSSSYRLESQQCRYAAESGLVISHGIIKNMIFSRAQTAPNEDTDPLEPNSLMDSFDPNSLFGGSDDPNAWDMFMEDLPEKETFVIRTEELAVGEAEVTIEIQDENAKWPVLWLLRSPFRGNDAQKEFLNYAKQMGYATTDARRAVKLVKEIGRKIEKVLPPPEVKVEARKRAGNRRRRRFMSYDKRLKEEQNRREVMGEFARQWQEALDADEDFQVLQQSLPDKANGFNDFLGIWGSNFININTTSPEILESAFSSLGMTRDKAEAIVTFRETTLFRNKNELHNVQGLEKKMVTKLLPLITVKSDSYSVYVTARLGRTEYNLIGSVYNYKGRVRFLSLIEDN